MKQKEVFKSGLKWNSLLAFSTAFFKFIRGLIVPKILLPEVYGLFTSIGVYQRYLNYADFGATAYLLKQYPRLYHNKEFESADELLNSVLNFFIISLAVSSVILLVLFRVYHGVNAEFYRWAFLLLIPITIIVNVRTLISNLAAITYNFKDNSKISVINDIASFIFIILGIYFKGAIGGVCGILLAETVNLIYAVFIVKPPINFSFSLSWIKIFPHFVRQLSVGLVELVAGTFDVVVILMLFAGSAIFGYYSLALAFSWGMIAISSVIATTVMPKVMALSYNEKHLIADLSYRSTLIYLLICFAVFIPISFFLVIILKVYFLHYQFSIYFIFLVLFSGVLRGLNALQKVNVLAFDRENKYIVRAIIIFSIYFIAAFVFKHLKLDFLKYIYLISVTDIAYSVCLIFKAGPKYTVKASINILKIVTVFALVVYCIQFLMPRLPVNYTFYWLFMAVVAVLVGTGLFFKTKLISFVRAINF